MRRCFRALPCVIGMAFAVPSAAQITDDAFGRLFDELTLKEALDESIEHSKLLVLYVDEHSYGRGENDRSRACIDSAERDRLLRFWLRQHAVIVRVGPEHRELAAQIFDAAQARCSRGNNIGIPGMIMPRATLPVFGVFVGGELFSAVAACRVSTSALPDDTFQAGERNFANKLGVSMNWALFELDFQLDRLKAMNPVWFGLHELRNPPLEAAAKTYFSDVEDANADRFAEKLVGDRSDVLGVIRLARTQAELGDRFGATATYTWLWERGAEQDPDFGPAIRRLVAADVQDLVRRWENVEERFVAMKAAATRRIGTETLEEFADWLRLAAVTGDPLSQLAELDYRINSNYFGSLMARDERRVLLVIAETECEIPERLVLPDREADRLRGVLGRLERETSEMARTELRRVALDQAVMLHARLLEVGEETQARSIAELAIDRLGPEAGRALVAGALVQGVARPWHRAYLPAEGGSGPLAGHLQRALEEAEFSEPDPNHEIRLVE